MREAAPGRRRTISPWHAMQTTKSPATKSTTRQMAKMSLSPFLARYAMPTSATGSRPSHTGLQ